MPKQPLKRIIGVLGDRARLQNVNGNDRTTEEAWLFVNGGGQVLALTQEQLNLQGYSPVPDQDAEQSEPKPSSPPPGYQQEQTNDDTNI